MFSAVVIDHLWQSVQAAWNSGIPFAITWTNMGQELLQLSIQYFFTWIFYYLQSYLTANVAENLNLELREPDCPQTQSTAPRASLTRTRRRSSQPSPATWIRLQRCCRFGLLNWWWQSVRLSALFDRDGYYSVSLTCIFLDLHAASMGITQVVAKKNLRCAAERQETIGS